MPFDTYANLQSAVLEWLMRPGDPLVAPAVPDMISLFEAEARRRLRIRLGETLVVLTTAPGVATVPLPPFYAGVRTVRINSSPVDRLTYITPEEMDATWIGSTEGQPRAFTIEGMNVRFARVPDTAYDVDFYYYAGIPALSTSDPNWLLANHPDLYLFGTLGEAEAFIGNDERITTWLARREAAFQSIEAADNKERWSGSVLQMRTDTGNP